MTAVMEETHLLLIDGVLYDNTLTRLEFPGEVPKGVTAIYTGLAQHIPNMALSHTNITEFGVEI